MNIWKGSSKKTKKTSSVTPAAEGDDGLPDVLVGHAMLARQDYNNSRLTTSWQHQYPPPVQQQHNLSHHVQQQQPSASLQPPPQPAPPPPPQQHSTQYHHGQQQSFTPLGLGAHGGDWRNEGPSSVSGGSGDHSGAQAYQDPGRGYSASTHHSSSFTETEASNRYGSQHCSGLPDAESNHRYYHQTQSSGRENELHFGQHQMSSSNQESDTRFSQNFTNPSDSDDRYLAIPVSDTGGTSYTQQPCEEDNRQSYSHNSTYQIDNGVTVRYRSMSSEPRAGRKDADHRRVRCSSANRVRQTRSRNIITTSSSVPLTLTSAPIVTSPPVTSPTLSPSQSNLQPIITTACSSSVVQAQQLVTSPVMDRQNWDPGPSQQATAISHEIQPDDRAYGSMHTPAASSSGSYGYQVEDLESLLCNSSASQPANLPMVLASPTRLHHMRRTQANAGPSRPFLPLGVIVNAVFKTRDWLYVRTAHGAEGFVPYHVCLPLGILPTKPAAPANEAPAAAWEMQEGPLPRGRCRERRRQAGSTSSQNQTDLQKLQPLSMGSSTLPRETFSQHQHQSLRHSQRQPHHSSQQPPGQQRN